MPHMFRVLQRDYIDRDTDWDTRIVVLDPLGSTVAVVMEDVLYISAY